MFSTRIFKTVIAMLLLLTLTCGLLACGAAPSEKSFDKAYDKAVDELLESIDQYYDNTNKYDMQDMKIDAEIGVDLSDDLLNLLRSYTAQDLSFVNDAKINFTENLKGDTVSMALGLAYGKNDIISANIIMDMVGKNAFVDIPVLSDLALKAPIEAAEIDSFGAVNNIDLPDQKALEGLIGKIYAIVMNGLGEPTFSKVELTVNGVAESCVAYENELSQKEVVAVALDLLEMLETDEDFKTVIMDAVATANESFVPEDAASSPEVGYQDAVEAIREAIEDIKSRPAEDFTDEKALVLTSYVSDKLDIIGIKLDFYDMGEATTFYMATAKNKDNVGREIYLTDGTDKAFEITGALTDDGKTLAGTYELKVEGESMAFLDLENVNVKKLEDGYFLGSLSLSPSKGLIDMITEEADLDFSAAGLTVASLSLRFDVEKNDGKEVEATVSLMSGSAPYASITFDGKISGGEAVTLPSDSTTDAEGWAAGLKFDKLLENVKNSGLPAFIVELVEMLASTPE